MLCVRVHCRATASTYDYLSVHAHMARKYLICERQCLVHQRFGDEADEACSGDDPIQKWIVFMRVITGERQAYMHDVVQGSVDGDQFLLELTIIVRHHQCATLPTQELVPMKVRVHLRADANMALH